MTTIWWIRRDLRLFDNQALDAAVGEGRPVIPLFIIDPFFDRSAYVAQNRRAFLYAGLRQLDAALRERGSRLVVRTGEPVQVLRKLLDESDATQIYAEADYSPYAQRRDFAVAAALPLILTGGLTIRPVDAVLKQDGDPYVVFTPFSNRWKEQPPQRPQLIPAPSQLTTPAHIHSDEMPARPSFEAEALFPAGENAAHKRLDDFSDAAITDYAGRRDRLDLDGTSRLSPYLRFGMLSARHAAVTALEAIRQAGSKSERKGAETWLSELIWREFYITILYHFTSVRTENFNPRYEHLAWRNDPAEFEAWCAGRTGFPVVDAAMRQLNETGWMHNRARMIVASFLVKDLLIDWRWGERYFMQQLIDGDPAANNGGWQWSAGTGTDAAPYFRIFNPITQGKKHDPDGAYIRRWVPELASLPDKYLHEPWTLPRSAQKELDFEPGHTYPHPVVDHGDARKRTLSAYKTARERYDQQHS